MSVRECDSRVAHRADLNPILTKSPKQLSAVFMHTALPKLSPEGERILEALLRRKAMPLLEIAGVTGVYGSELEKALSELAEKHLVERNSAKPAPEQIVMISGKL